MGAATTSKQKSPAQKPEGEETLDLVWKANSDYFETLTKANEAWLFGLAKVGQEVLSFTGERLRQRMALSEELLHCKNLEDALRIQVEHTQSATQDYMAEANKLLELTTHLNQDFWTQLHSETPRVKQR